MKTNNRSKGKKGETAALGQLLREGLVLIDKNYCTRMGEIDLIMDDSGVLVFVEVKMKTDLWHGTPEEMINRTKLARIKKSALSYLLNQKTIANKYHSYRIDAACLIIRDNKIQYYKHYRNLY